MKTERLFDCDPYLKVFCAEVLHVLPYEGNYGVILDRTAFYPEGGGQPSDTGHLDDATVLQVIEKDGEILHITDKPIESREIRGSIDWARRFDLMQQHTGQHILSACFEEMFGGRTDSFHMGKDISSIEIDIDSFSSNDAESLENEANDIIYKNLPIIVKVVSKEELQSLPLRKMPVVTENIRIVNIEEVDCSPCGGTHVKATGEVGIIKIKNWERCKGGIRFIFVCGSRALKDYSLDNSIIRGLGEIFSVKDTDIIEAAGKMLNNLKITEKRLLSAAQELIKYEAENIIKEHPAGGSIKLISRIFEGRSMDDIRLLARYLTQTPNTITLLASKNEIGKSTSSNVQVVFSRSENMDMDMNSIFKATIHIIDGKGGGSARSAQGGGSKVEGLEEFMKTAESMANI